MNTTIFEFRNMCDFANSLYTHTLPVECMSYLNTPVVQAPNIEVFCMCVSIFGTIFFRITISICTLLPL